MKKINIALVLTFILSVEILGQQPAWFKKIKSIELLKANREDIVRLFGESKESANPHWRSYELNDGDMEVEYSPGLCGAENKIGWNVSEFTVTRIFFTPNKSIKPRELGIDLTKFRKHNSSDVPGAFSYENKNTGIDFGVKRNGNIEIFEFRPPDKYNKLFCKND